MDNSTENSHQKSRFRPIAAFIFATQFLTRLPLPFADRLTFVPMSQSMGMFGLVGATIGVATGAVLLAVNALNLPPLMGMCIVVAFGLMLTGALHEDGLADTFDGLFGGRTKERRLEIMRDSRIGTYGACALLLALLMRIGAYEKLSTLPWHHVILILAATGAVSRAMMVSLLTFTPPGRTDGLAHMSGTPTKSATRIANLTAVAVVLFSLWATSLFIGPAYGLAILVMLGIRHIAIRKIGGHTGDICGATQVLCELNMLTVILATIH